MKIILHIGSDKTGTTSIQRILGRQRDLLADHKICYPQLDKTNNHERLARELKSGSKGPGWAKLEKAISRKPEILFLSSEMFCTFSKSEIRLLNDWLGDYPTTVICFVRRPDEYLESGLFQRLKTSGSHREFSLLYYTACRVPALLNPFAYQAALKPRFLARWRNTYRSEEFHALNYESGKVQEQGVCALLLQTLRLDALLAILKNTEQKRNKTPDLAVAYACQMINSTSRPDLKHQVSNLLVTKGQRVKTEPITTVSTRKLSLILTSMFCGNSLLLHGIKWDSSDLTPRIMAPMSMKQVRAQGVERLVEFISMQRT